LELRKDSGVLAEVSRGSAKESRTLTCDQFIEAASIFGLEAHQARHFFEAMDRDGNQRLTLQEFLAAMTNMPREVLLHDFRQRVLARFSSLGTALQALAGSSVLRFSRSDFTTSMCRLGIVEIEAVELFRIIDDDNSGYLSLEELRQAMRKVAPSTSLEEFWQRVAAEWPELSASAAARNAGTSSQRSSSRPRRSGNGGNSDERGEKFPRRIGEILWDIISR